MSSPRDSFEVVRYDWLGVRIGGPGASMHGSWRVLIAAMLVVFGCFFAVGRLSGGSGSPKQGSSAAPVARAAVPGELRGGTPIPAGVPSAIAEPPRPRTTPARGTEAVRPTAPFAAAGATTTTTTTSAAPPTETAVAQEAGPTQASTQSTGGGTHTGGSSGNGSAATGAGASRGGGGAGGSFDTSE